MIQHFPPVDIQHFLYNIRTPQFMSPYRMFIRSHILHSSFFFLPFSSFLPPPHRRSSLPSPVTPSPSVSLSPHSPCFIVTHIFCSFPFPPIHFSSISFNSLRLFHTDFKLGILKYEAGMLFSRTRAVVL